MAISVFDPVISGLKRADELHAAFYRNKS